MKLEVDCFIYSSTSGEGYSWFVSRGDEAIHNLKLEDYFRPPKFFNVTTAFQFKFNWLSELHRTIEVGLYWPWDL